MESISKTALKARMLEHLRRVEETGQGLVVTDRGRPVVRIVPIRTRRPAEESFAGLREKVVYHGDFLQSTAGEWPDR